MAETTPEILGVGELIERGVVLSKDIAQGTPVFFHVHNHDLFMFLERTDCVRNSK